ncbi:MAG: hypothetical protein WDA27_09625 [Actinomycetota bacterium]
MSEDLFVEREAGDDGSQGRNDEVLALHELGETVREAILRVRAMEDRLESTPSIADFSLLRGQMRSDLDDWAQGMQDRVSALGAGIADIAARVERFESASASLLRSEVAASEGRVTSVVRDAVAVARAGIEATATASAERFHSESAAAAESIRAEILAARADIRTEVASVAIVAEETARAVAERAAEILRAVPSAESFAAGVGERIDALLRDLPRADRLAAVLGERLDTAVRDVGESAGRIEETLRMLPARLGEFVRADLEGALGRLRPADAEASDHSGSDDQVAPSTGPRWFRRFARGPGSSRRPSPEVAPDAGIWEAVSVPPPSPPALVPESPVAPPAPHAEGSPGLFDLLAEPIGEFAEPIEVFAGPGESLAEPVELPESSVETTVTVAVESGEEVPESGEEPSHEIVRALELARELDSTAPPQQRASRSSAKSASSTKTPVRKAVAKKTPGKKIPARAADAKRREIPPRKRGTGSVGSAPASRRRST